MVTLRFCWRPSAVALVATGSDWPREVTMIGGAAAPSRARSAAATAPARCPARVPLVGRPPMVSVYPVTVTAAGFAVRIRWAAASSTSRLCGPSSAEPVENSTVPTWPAPAAAPVAGAGR